MKISRKSSEQFLLQALGNSLKLHRKKRNLTQERLAELSGVNYKYIGEIERGEKNPTFITLYRIATGLSIELAELVMLIER